MCASVRVTKACAATRAARRQRNRAKVKEMFAVDLDIDTWDIGDGKELLMMPSK